jgi:hypothetical protein
MERLQILNGARAPKVEEISSDAEVPSLGSFARCDVRQRMLDSDACTERGSPRGGALQLSEFLLLRFVGCDGDAATVAARGLGEQRHVS